MGKDRQFVTALARGVAVMRCFTPERPELGTTEIAALARLPQSTVWRLCHTLEQVGLLAPGREAGKLRPAFGLLTLGHATLLSTGLVEAALPRMQEIARRFDAAVSLGARDRLGMVILQRTEAPTILRLALHVGSALPIATSALGWAWLAGAAAADREPVLAAIRRAAGARWPERRRAIEEALLCHAAHGYVFNLRQYHPDVNAIGVPVVSPSGRRVMALNCGGAASVVTRERLAGPIAAAVRGLAAALAPMLDAT